MGRHIPSTLDIPVRTVVALLRGGPCNIQPRCRIAFSAGLEGWRTCSRDSGLPVPMPLAGLAAAVIAGGVPAADSNPRADGRARTGGTSVAPVRRARLSVVLSV